MKQLALIVLVLTLSSCFREPILETKCRAYRTNTFTGNETMIGWEKVKIWEMDGDLMSITFRGKRRWVHRDEVECTVLPLEGNL